MLKKIMLFAAAILLIASLMGCSCNGVTTTPTPSPAAQATPMGGANTDAMGSPDPGATPGSGDVGMGMSTSDMDPGGGNGGGTGSGTDSGTGSGSGSGTGTGTGSGTGAGGTGTIANFKEGTEVKAEDVPEIKKAVEDKYAGGTIKTVKHAMNGSQQVYEVDVSVGGSTKTVYVTPDGTVTEKTA